MLRLAGYFVVLIAFAYLFLITKVSWLWIVSADRFREQAVWVVLSYPLAVLLDVALSKRAKLSPTLPWIVRAAALIPFLWMITGIYLLTGPMAR